VRAGDDDDDMTSSGVLTTPRLFAEVGRLAFAGVVGMLSQVWARSGHELAFS
jgi:hypothetical protein